MKTDNLIDALVADRTPRGRPLPWLLVAALLAGLPERQRRIVEEISLEGHRAAEVAERLGMSEGAVRVTLHRALKALAAAYRRGER